MPLLFVLLLVLLPLAIVLLIPVSLVQRYRVGTARRPARGWIVTLNLIALVVSSTIFLASAAVASLWLPGALTHALGGLAIGIALGFLGLALTRWEPTPEALFYTPNRWLVLAITLSVTARVIYGFLRSWQAWQSRLDDRSWVAASGAAESLAAGAIVLGYYLAYWLGVRWRVKRRDASTRD